jgi:hypothetical protein
LATNEHIVLWSYPRHHDKAKEIYRALKSHKVPVWWEEEDLELGQVKSYRRALESAQRVILCFGSSYDTVKDEHRKYLTEIFDWYQHQGERDITLIPVRLDENVTLKHEILSDLNPLDYIGNDSQRETALAKLVKALDWTQPTRALTTNNIETEIRYANTPLVHSFCELVAGISPQSLFVAYNDMLYALGDPLLARPWDTANPAKIIAEYLSGLPLRPLPVKHPQQGSRVSLLTIYLIGLIARDSNFYTYREAQVVSWLDENVIDNVPKEQANALRYDINQLYHLFCNLQRQVPSSQERCLLVDVSSDGYTPYYEMRASLVQASPYDDLATPEATCLQVFEPQRLNGRGFLASELESAFGDVYWQYRLYNAQSHAAVSKTNLYIVFFLPLELISQLEIHRWKCRVPDGYLEECHIYLEHTVLVRSAERLMRSNDQDWYERWRILQSTVNPVGKSSIQRAFICDDNQSYNQTIFDESLFLPSVIGLGMAVPFKPYQSNQWHPLKSAYQRGVPIAVWGRHESHDLKTELRHALEEFFQVAQLPNLRDQFNILRRRVRVEGLTLLLDNPNLIPPNHHVTMQFRRRLSK